MSVRSRAVARSISDERQAVLYTNIAQVCLLDVKELRVNECSCACVQVCMCAEVCETVCVCVCVRHIVCT